MISRTRTGRRGGIARRPKTNVRRGRTECILKESVCACWRAVERDATGLSENLTRNLTIVFSRRFPFSGHRTTHGLLRHRFQFRVKLSVRFRFRFRFPIQLVLGMLQWNKIGNDFPRKSSKKWGRWGDGKRGGISGSPRPRWKWWQIVAVANIYWHSIKQDGLFPTTLWCHTDWWWWAVWRALFTHKATSLRTGDICVKGLPDYLHGQALRHLCSLRNDIQVVRSPSCLFACTHQDYGTYDAQRMVNILMD